MPPTGEGKEGEGRWKALTGEKPTAELLDPLQEELVSEDSRLHTVTSRCQAATSRHRLLASRAANVASRHLTLPLALRCGSRRIGFDPEGVTRGFDFFLQPGLRNEAGVVTFSVDWDWNRPTKIPLDRVHSRKTERGKSDPNQVFFLEIVPIAGTGKTRPVNQSNRPVRRGPRFDCGSQGKKPTGTGTRLGRLHRLPR
jgi:hypothetical protein